MATQENEITNLGSSNYKFKDFYTKNIITNNLIVNNDTSLNNVNINGILKINNETPITSNQIPTI